MGESVSRDGCSAAGSSAGGSVVYRKSSPSEAELSDSSAASSSSLGRSLEVWSMAKNAKSSNREGADRPVPLDRESAIDSEVIASKRSRTRTTFFLLSLVEINQKNKRKLGCLGEQSGFLGFILVIYCPRHAMSMVGDAMVLHLLCRHDVEHGADVRVPVRAHRVVDRVRGWRALRGGLPHRAPRAQQRGVL